MCGSATSGGAATSAGAGAGAALGGFSFCSLFSRAGRRRAALRFLLRLRDELLLLLLDEDDEELDRPRRFFALPRGGRFVDRPLRCVGFRFARGRPRLRDELLELDELLDRERLRRRGILAFYSKPSISWLPRRRRFVRCNFGGT